MSGTIAQTRLKISRFSRFCCRFFCFRQAAGLRYGDPRFLSLIMARLPRLVIPFQVHHLLQAGNDRQAVFHAAEDYQAYLDWLGQASRQFKVALHAYVLMPNHVHLLASPTDDSGLGRMMQWIGRHYVPWFNRKYQRSGTLWQGRFKASLVDADNYFLHCCRYIESNPVRAQLAPQSQDYPWSSYAHHAGLENSGLITDHPLYWALGNTPFQREAAYRELSSQSLSPTQITQINQALLKGWALGSERYLHSLQQRTEQRVVPAKRGRPRKKPALTE